MTEPRRPRSPFTFVVGLDKLAEHERPSLHAPPVDVVEEERGWRLVFDIPGALPDRLLIDVKGRVVTLRGDRPPTGGERGRFLRVERATGPFERSLELPGDLDAEGAHASYADGLLTLEIPRRTGPKGRSIPIQRSGPRTP